MKNFCTVLLLALLPVLAAASQGNGDSTRTWYKLGLTERFRIETWDNAISMSNAANAGMSYNRTKTNLAAQLFPLSDLELMVRVTNEFKFYLAPSTRRFNSHEWFFDQLYLKWKNNDVVPGVFTVGRQNIFLGEGFLMADAGPGDGSRSFYFNALRYDIKPDAKNTVTLFYNFETPKDVQLPILHSQDQLIIEQPEQGAGVYYEGVFDGVNLQANAIHKHISAWQDTLPESKIFNLGGRIAYTFNDKHCVATAEVNYQFGTRGTADRAALGGYANLEYRPLIDASIFCPQSVTVGGIYLSGDKPSTSKFEGWDPLFSRYPKWSELYIYTLTLERGIAFWTDIATLNVKGLWSVGGGFTYSCEYLYLLAPQKSAPASAKVASEFGRGEGIRGRLIINKLGYKISPSTTGYVLWEAFVPGSFYMLHADPTSWIRIEMSVNI